MSEDTGKLGEIFGTIERCPCFLVLKGLLPLRREGVLVEGAEEEVEMRIGYRGSGFSEEQGENKCEVTVELVGKAEVDHSS